MNGLQWIWLLLVLACVVWYSTITFYVAVRGFLDIKHMLRRAWGPAGSGGRGGAP